MKLSIISLTAFISLGASAPSPPSTHEAAQTPLELVLTREGNTLVNAALTNTGTKALKLMFLGTFLDNGWPTSKLQVSSSAGPAEFVGILVRPAFNNISESDFKLIKPGQTLENKIDIATVYDISKTGDYTVLASGAMPYAEAGSTALTTGNAVSYRSNSLVLSVDGTEAAQVPKAIPPVSLKRTNIASDCYGSRLTVFKDGLANCELMSNLAAQAANTNNAKSNARFVQYFKTNHPDDHVFVARRFRAVARDCSINTGTTISHCRDPYGLCYNSETGAVSNAYAFSAGPHVNNIVYCDPYFEDEPAIAPRCHEYDQGTTILHEETHCPAVLNPINQDYAYQYAASSKLNAYQSLHNADSYNLYANAVYLDCPIQSP